MRDMRFETIEEAVETVMNRARTHGFDMEKITVEPLKQNDGAWVFIPYKGHKGNGCFTILPHSKKDKRYSIRNGKWSC